MAGPSVTLTLAKLVDLEACRRRFELRYLDRLAWPAQPEDEAIARRVQLGARFHQLMQRHFLGLPVADEAAADPQLARWWAAYQDHGPALLTGRRLAEVKLTAPLGRHQLSGRFDLLVIAVGGGPGEHPPGLQIVDWKTTARPPGLDALRRQMQTRLYLALAAVGGAALGHAVAPEQIRLTYWFAAQPQATVTLAYDSAWHADNWAYLTDLVGEIDRRLAQPAGWPLTADLSNCRHCAYQVVCGREMADLDLTAWAELDEQPALEPDLP